MPGDYRDQVLSLLPAKALAVAAYGESVAAYRYRTLIEKATSERLRRTFETMAAEEQSHHKRVQDLMKRHFPDSDFVLTAEDKDLVIVGPRMLDVSDQASFDRALASIVESERLTGLFYAALYDSTTRDDMKPLLKEMAEECLEHARSIEGLSNGD